MFWKYVIVIAALFLFIGTFLLNKKVKAPVKTPEELKECENCTNILCKEAKKGIIKENNENEKQ